MLCAPSSDKIIIIKLHNIQLILLNKMETLEVHKICLWPLPIKADAFCSSQCRRCCWLVLEDDFLSRDNWHMIINSKDSFLCGRSRNFLKLPGQSLLYYYSLMWKKIVTYISFSSTSMILQFFLNFLLQNSSWALAPYSKINYNF